MNMHNTKLIVNAGCQVMNVYYPLDNKKKKTNHKHVSTFSQSWVNFIQKFIPYQKNK